MSARNRVHVMHGANMDQLGRRDAAHYGGLTFDELQFRIDGFADELDLDARFFHSNHEGAFVEELHRVTDLADAVLLNPGAWTHYSWAIHDALELAAVPAVEVHLSDVRQREDWRQVSVVSDLCVATVSGQGVDGYREGLVRLKGVLDT